MMKVIQKHKWVSIATCIVIFVAGYYGYAALWKEDASVRYVLAAVERGTIMTSVSGSGQVSASNQLDVKPKASGEIVYLPVKQGDTVIAGAILARLNSRDAEKAVRDAQVSLASAQLTLDKLKKPADAYAILQAENALAQAKRDFDDLLKPPDVLALLQAENAVTQARETKTKAEDNLTKAYEDGFNAVANAFLDLPDVVTGLNDMLYTSTMSGGGGQWNIDYYASSVNTTDYAKALLYRDETNTKYQAARKAYDANFTNYKSATRLSDRATIEALLNETYETTRSAAEAVKSASNLIQFYRDSLSNRNVKPATLSDTHRASLDAYTGTTNGHLSTLLAIIRTIKDNKDAMVSADRAIGEKKESLDKLKRGPEVSTIETARERMREREESLTKLKAGADTLDLRSQELAVQQRLNTLRDAQEKLADYTIRAPFDGILANVDVKRGDTASASTVIATLITGRKIAEVTLNEVDVAKVRVGQRATLTFDAIPGLVITGETIEIDTVGTVSQGVVTYSVKIGFDTQDDRVKAAMSVTAVVVTEVKTDVLRVPNSAVKTQGENTYVEIVAADAIHVNEIMAVNGIELARAPQRQRVTVGIASDDYSEIIEGLTTDDTVVVRTVQPTAAQPVQRQNSLFQLPGGGGSGARSAGGGGQQRR